MPSGLFQARQTCSIPAAAAASTVILFVTSFLSFAVFGLNEQSYEIPPQMCQALAHDIRALLCLGKNEAALQDSLNEVAHAIRTPPRFRGVESFGGFDIPGQFRADSGDVNGAFRWDVNKSERSDAGTCNDA